MYILKALTYDLVYNNGLICSCPIQIFKSQVDSYQSPKQFSHCKLKVRYRGVASTGSDLTYRIEFLGAEKPYTFVVLCISSQGTV